MLIQLLISKLFFLTFIQTKQVLRKLSKTITLPVLYEENEDYYVIALGIGNPRTYFPVQIDTSTTTTWVPSINCSNCHSLSQYNSITSNTSKVQNKSYVLSDEDGDIEGVLTFDEIEVNSIIISNFGFLQASRLFDNFSDHEDGKLGLGYHHELEHSMNFIEMLKMKEIISERIFSIKEINYTHGELFIGVAPVAKYPFCDLISTEDLDDEYKEGWICQLNHLAFFSTNVNNEQNNTKLQFNQAVEVNSIANFDTASSYITAPIFFLSLFEKEVFSNYQNKCYQLNKGDSIYFRCDSSSHTKFGEGIELHFFFQGYSYLINLTELFEEVEQHTVEFFIRFRKENDPIWNLGHPFMRKFQIVFNAEENHVGLIGLSWNFVKEWNEWKNKKKQSFSWKLGLILILGLLLLILIIFLFYWLTRKKQQSLIKKEEKKNGKNEQFYTNSEKNIQ